MNNFIPKRAVILFVLFALIALYVTVMQPEKPTPLDSHLVKLNAQGEPLGNWQGPWHCVADNNTQLIWMNLSDDESIRDGYWSYSWFQDGTGTENFGDCYFEDDRCDSQDLIIRANAQKLCGLTHWRLPTTRELESLLWHEQQTGKAQIDPSFFPFTQRGDYWTSDHGLALTGIYQHLGQGASAVNFGNGETTVLPYRNAAFVRLVADKTN